MKELENLNKLKGQQFNRDEIIMAFNETDNEIVVDKIVGVKNNFEGHGNCERYIVYENIEDSEIFTIYVNCNNEIVEIY